MARYLRLPRHADGDAACGLLYFAAMHAPRNTGITPGNEPLNARAFLGAFRYSRRALELVWSTHAGLTLLFALFVLLAGTLPAAAAWIGQQIVDAVVAAIPQGQGADLTALWEWVLLEGLLMGGIAGAQAGINMCQSLLRGLLSQKVNVMILEKALTLNLEDFENSEFYDKLTRARREASVRPLSLVNRTFSLIQNLIALFSYGVLLFQFSPWAVLILTLAGLPGFLAETKFSNDAYKLARWRSPEARRRMYLETLLAREDYTKEVKVYGLGQRFLRWYREIFNKLFTEERRLILRRGFWGLVFTLLGTLAFYGAYAWVAFSTVVGRITLGQMTMYLLVFKQGQSAVSAALSAISGMYEDNLYLSNLYEYLEQEIRPMEGERTEGPDPDAGVEFRNVSFTYPGSDRPAIEEVSFSLKPGQSLALVGENGSGKTTLIKLLTRLYEPTAGEIFYQGLPLKNWNPQALQRQIAVIFQDFVRYQFRVGENIGVGDEPRLEDERGWEEAARLGMAEDFVQRLPEGFHTQLGRWFQGGQELSGGQWQKIALSRAFMRQSARILVLDEPTSAMDAEAEAQVFDHIRSVQEERMTILISHRFSTVRRADQILVMREGRIIEQGNHSSLMQQNGRYAHLFRLQAKGYE